MPNLTWSKCNYNVENLTSHLQVFFKKPNLPLHILHLISDIRPQTSKKASQQWKAFCGADEARTRDP